MWLKKGEILQIAKFLKMTPAGIEHQFCRRVFLRTSLLECPNGDCVFFTPAGCRIYPVRPAQCRSFPFWKQHLNSPAHWESLKAQCPGVGTGRLYSRDEIEAVRNGERATAHVSRDT